MQDPFYPIEVFSTVWWWGWAYFGAYSLFLMLMARANDNLRLWTERILGYSLMALYLGVHLHQVASGVWSPSTSLPGHLCSISFLLAVIYLTTGSTKVLLPLTFWGITGGAHALITPASPLGDHPLYIAEFWVQHTTIVLVPLYALRSGAWLVPARAWIKAFWGNQLLLVPIFILNRVAGANYQFLLSPPAVNNPLLIGPWPWYLVGIDGLMLGHYWLIQKWLGKRS